MLDNRDLIFVPIERLEERYSSQWFRWFERDFDALGINSIVVGDERQRRIGVGEFLDVFGTCQYKTQQMLEILDLVAAGFEGTIFFMDGWFPGLEHLAYIRSNAKRKLRLVGILHAGTWDPFDFLSQNGCRPWARWSESSWLESFDKILVATEFHKELIEDAMGCVDVSKKIEVVRFPCYQNDVLRDGARKENIVTFPHRLAPETRPEDFTLLEKTFRALYPDAANDLVVRFVRTKDVCKTKEEYYQFLARSKVVFSSAMQETFGIAMLEGVALGCWPVAPDRLSYRETLREFPRYKSIEEAAKMVLDALLRVSGPVRKFDDDVTSLIKSALEI